MELHVVLKFMYVATNQNHFFRFVNCPSQTSEIQYESRKLHLCRSYGPPLERDKCIVIQKTFLLGYVSKQRKKNDKRLFISLDYNL